MPANLERFSAVWLPPAESVRDVVDAYWRVRWELTPGEVVTQQVLEFPAVTLSIESGAVPAPFVVTAVQRRAWSRSIAGSGEVFGVRLRPAGLAVVSDLVAVQLGAVTPLTSAADARAHRLLEVVRDGASPDERARLADAAIGELVADRPPPPLHLLANAVVDALTARVESRSGRRLAVEVGASERSIQRALRATLGMGPKAVARRIRLQEVVRRFSEPHPDVAAIATELGYVDQAHLVNDFRSVAGITPGRYVRDLRTAMTR